MTLTLPKPPTWMNEGTCASIGGWLWFPDSSNPNSPARKICDNCPVKQECLNFALSHGESDGIWGGTTVVQRRHMDGWTPKGYNPLNLDLTDRNPERKLT